MSKNVPIKIGIIGLGRAGWGMQLEELELWKDKFAVLAGCDLIPERLEKFGKRYPDCRVYLNMDDLLSDPDVELVSVATRSVDHFAHTMAALQAGKNVLVEKPMSCTSRDAHILAKQSGRPGSGRLFVRHNRRFEPDFIYVRGLIDSGKLGNVFEIRLARNGFQRRDDWQTLSKFCGGQMLNWGPHIIDHSLRLLDAPVRRITSQLTRIVAAGDCEDHVKMLIIGENERIIDIEISGGVAGHIPEYIIYGTRGTAIIHEGKANIHYIDPEQELPEIHADPGTPVPYFGSSGTFENSFSIHWIDETVEILQEPGMDIIWDYLYASIRDGKPFPITLEEAVQVICTIYAQKQSSAFPVKGRRFKK